MGPSGGNLGPGADEGFLHRANLSLVARARRENERVGVSIFVNPTQFNDTRDLAAYPRDLERDLKLLEQEGVDLVWTPGADIVYPPGYQTVVEVEQVTRPLEGAARPGHFRGVTTVVAKLFNVFQPQRAYFGQKECQQVVVVKQNGARSQLQPGGSCLPPSSEKRMAWRKVRGNARLSPAARQQATCLYRALTAARQAYEQGQRNGESLRQVMLAVLAAEPLARPDYVSVAHPETLAELAEVDDRALLSMAVFVGDVRLIDNMVVG